MGKQKYLILDFETRSRADLRAVGAVEYSRHPSTEIMCVAWTTGTREDLETSLIGRRWFRGPQDILTIPQLDQLLQDPTIIKVARNAMFEQAITQNVLYRRLDRRPLPPREWLCTASLAAALALPRSLEGTCLALDLPVQKDMDGRRLMLKHTKPRKPTKNNPKEWHDDPDEQRRILEYCVKDVDADRRSFLKMPPLTPLERKVWVLDQKVNLRGIKIDRPLVKTTLKLIAEETKVLNQRTFDITDGIIETTNKRAKLQEWLKENGCALPNLQKKTVEDALGAGMATGAAEEILKIRLAISKTSTAKYEAFEMRSASDGILRDLMMYHGASTGRWTGTGVQVHNFPRGSIKDTYTAVDLVKLGDLEALRLFYGEPMSLFSSCLRSAIIAREGNEFFCGDYSSIEVRVLFWMAGHEAGLRSYREKKDLYIEQAAEVFNRPVTKEDHFERQIGKKLILGAGYGLGAQRFFDSCKEDRLDGVDMDLAKKSIASYREKHHPVPKLWHNLEKVAITATRNPGRIYSINRTRWFVKNGFLWCELPSGRKLAYRKPSIHMIKTPWGDKREALHHWGVHPKTKQWTIQKTWGGTLCENVVQAVARDLMAEAGLRLEGAGYAVALSVHDELLTERAGGSLEEFRALMGTVPAWGAGLPVTVDCWQGPRYRKG